MIIAYEQVEPIVEPTVVENRARFELMNWIESIGGEKLLRGPISSVAFISEYWGIYYDLQIMLWEDPLSEPKTP